MNTQEKADNYNERAKKQIRTKAYQKAKEETTAAYKAQIRDLKKENKALKIALEVTQNELARAKKKTSDKINQKK